MRRLLGTQRVRGNLKAIRTDIVSQGIGVHPRAPLDGIALRRGCGRRAQEHYCRTRHCNEPIHEQFPLLVIQKAKSSLGPICTSV